MVTTSVAAHLRVVVARTARRLRQEAGTDLSPSQTSALAAIERHGPLTPSELAGPERIQRPTATRVLGGLGGVLADRVPKRRLLTVTQGVMAVPAIALFALVETGAVQTWMVFALILARGSVNAVDNPARQSFVSEMVGVERVVNAVSLNSVIVHVARIAGPALAALVIATAGVGPCFAISALSSGAMLVALRRMTPRALQPARVASREPGQLRAAVRYVLAEPGLRTPLAMMAVIGTLSYNFQVLLP